MVGFESNVKSNRDSYLPDYVKELKPQLEQLMSQTYQEDQEDIDQQPIIEQQMNVATLDVPGSVNLLTKQSEGQKTELLTLEPPSTKNSKERVPVVTNYKMQKMAESKPEFPCTE